MGRARTKGLTTVGPLTDPVNEPCTTAGHGWHGTNTDPDWMKQSTGMHASKVLHAGYAGHGLVRP